jgi:hypothetical protein
MSKLSTSITQFKATLVPPPGADEMALGKALISTIVLSILIFASMALFTLTIGFAYWIFFLT